MVLCLCPTLISGTSRNFVQLVEYVLTGGALAEFFLVGANCVVQQALLPLALQLQCLLDHIVRELEMSSIVQSYIMVQNVSQIGTLCEFLHDFVSH